MHIATVTFVAAVMLSCNSKNSLSGYSIGSAKLPLCTGAEKTTADQAGCIADDTLNRSAVTYVDAANGLPKCDATKKGAIYYVAKDKSLQSCDGRAWQIINAQGVAGAPGAPGAKGEAGAPATTQNNYYTEVSAVTTVVESSRTITRSLIKYSTAQGGTLVKTCTEDTWREAAGVLNGYKAFWRGYGDKACGDSTTESIRCNGGYAAVGGSCVAVCSSNNLSACNSIDLCTNSGMTWASGRCVGACSTDNLAACNSLTKCQGTLTGNGSSGPGVWAGSQCLPSCVAGQIKTNRGCELAAVCPATKRLIDNQCVDASFAVQGGNICGKYTTTVKFTAGPHIVNCDAEFLDAVIIEPGATFKVDGPWTMRFAKTLYAVGTTTDPITFEASSGNAARKWLSLSVSNDHGYGSLAPFTLSSTYNFGTKLDFVTIKDLAASTSSGSVSLAGYVTNLSIPTSDTAVNLGTTSSPLYIESSSISANTVSAQMDSAHETAVINNTITANVEFKANSGLIWRNTITAPDTKLNSGSQGLVLFNTITGNLSCTGSASPALAQAYGNKVSGTISLSSCPNQSDNSTSLSDGTFAFADDGTLGQSTSTVTNRSTPISALILKATGWVTGATVNLELSTKLNGATIPINLQTGYTPPVLIGLPGIYTAKVKSVLATSSLLGNVSRIVTVYAQGNGPFVMSKGAITNNANWTWSSAVGVSGKTYRYKFNDANFMIAPTETKLLSYDAVSTLPDGTYTFYVQEKDENGNWSDATSSTIFLDKTIPKTAKLPTGPSPFTGSKDVTFTWENPGDNLSTTGEGSGVISYNVKIGTKLGLSDVFNGNVRGLSKTITGVDRGTYYASVQAVDSGGNVSPFSSSSAAVTVDLTVPNTPPTPTTSGIYTKASTVTFNWTGPGDNLGGSGIASYNLQIGSFKGGSDAFNGNVVGAVSKTIPTLDGKTYYARVQSVDAAGNTSAFSESSIGIAADLTAPAIPAAPTSNMSASRYGTFIFSWLPPADNAGGTGVAKYNLKIGTTPGGSDVGTYSVTDLNRTITGNNGSIWYASVEAVDRAGNGSGFSPSSDRVIVDKQAPNKPSAPTTPTPRTKSSAVTFNWSAGSDVEPGSGVGYYNLRVGTSPNSRDVFDAKVYGLTKTVTLTNAPAYYAIVQTVDNAGNESAWSENSVKIEVDGIAPEASGGGIITASSITSTNINLSWVKGQDNASPSGSLYYQVYQSTTGNISTLPEITTNGVAFGPLSLDIPSTTVMGLEANRTYYFNVVIQDQAGNQNTYTMVSVDTAMTTPWTWMKGSSSNNGSAVYGLNGEAATLYTPGGRQQAASWVDSANGLWLFGGSGSAIGTTATYFNDLWKFDGTNWIYAAGSSTTNQSGKYGSDGTYAPGSRASAVSWTDSDSKLWLFGGAGYDSAGSFGYLNDLWKYDPSTSLWTWISGGTVSDQIGNYGTKGTASASNVPRSRYGSVTWLEPRPSTSSNNLWLFGGYSRDVGAGIDVLLNDLWKFDSNTQNWTWVSGSQNANQRGVYGTLGVGSSLNTPGARSGAVSWYDSYGNLWLFGGSGYGESGSAGNLNDLWKFYGGSWTWVSGSKTANSQGNYGQKGLAASSNIPGARNAAIAWMDRPPVGNMWLFGGSGFDANGVNGLLNDLWRFDGTNWTWISGSYTVSQSGTYGQFGKPSATNVPGSRSAALSWIDGSNILWLFGGYGFDQAGSMVLLNDLWKGRP